MPPSPHIVVVGGGPAGIATALRLQQHGLTRLTVLEAADHTAPKIGETLQPPSRRELEALGLWPSFLADAHLPASLTASVWGTPHVEFNDFIFRPLGRGWHLDRPRFDRRLAQCAAERGIALHRHTRLIRAERTAAGWRLELAAPGQPTQPAQAPQAPQAPQTLACDFVVDATGRKAVFARAQDARPTHFDELFGCYQFFAEPPAAGELPGHTLVESVPDGWWYSARLPGRRFVAAFMTDGSTVRALHTHEPGGLQAALATSTHTAARLRPLSPLGGPVVTPAQSQLLDPVHGADWLAVGDAAASYDPLSSMGIHQALRSGLAAANTLAAHVKGDADALPAYARALCDFYRRYLETKEAYYRVEQRWPRQSFWAGRHTSTSSIAASARSVPR